MKSYNQALDILKKSVIKINDEYIVSSKSLNRVSAENIFTSVDYPSANNSSVDGFAINSKETEKLTNNSGKFFKISGTITAGYRPRLPLIKKSKTFEIMTGALLPKGFDTIIPFEKAIYHPNKKKPKYIFINKKIGKNINVRFKGSDYKKKDLVIKKGTILQSKHILVLKTLGIKKIKVKKIINILFFSSGDEITDNKKVPIWKTRNSINDYIKSLNNNFLFNFKYGGILKDNHQNFFKNKINKLINSKIDILITSGAVSSGKFDYIPNVIRKFKTLNFFHGVMIRPGKPILFAKIKQKVIFGLPGNPISSAACFRFFVYPFIENILNIPPEKPVKGILSNNFEKKKNFTRFIKSKLNTTKNGKLKLKLLSGQESFRINSFIKSNIWAVLPRGKSKFKKGQIINCYLPNHSNKILD